MKKFIVILSAYVALLACKKTESNTQNNDEKSSNEFIELTDKQVEQLGIFMDSLKLGSYSRTLKVKGMTEVPPQNTISISVPIGGYLQKIYPIQGSPVKKGEILAVLQDLAYIQLQQEYLSAKAKWAFLEKDYERQSILKEVQAVSDKRFEEIKMEYETQKVLLKSLEKKLQLIGIDVSKLNENTLTNQIELRSPVNGFVSAIYKNTGKYIQPTDVILELVDISDVHLVLNVYEKDAAFLRLGQKVKFYSNENPEQIYYADVISIGKKVHEDRMLEVDCHLLEEKKNTWIPGQYWNAEIEIGKQSAWRIPNDALLKFQEKHFIYVPIKANQYKRLPARLLYQEKDFSYIELDEPVQRYVKKGAYNLLMVQENKEE